MKALSGMQLKAVPLKLDVHLQRQEEALRRESTGAYAPLAGTMSTALPRPVPPRISPRQREVLWLIASGHTQGEVAASLGIALETIKNHMAQLYRAFGARNAAHLAALAVARGAIDLNVRPSPSPFARIQAPLRNKQGRRLHGDTQA